jgi:hypothetical protein
MNKENIPKKKYKLKIINKFILYKRTILLIILILLGISISIDINLTFKYDYDENYPNEHNIIFDITGINVKEYKANLEQQIKHTNNEFTKGDIYLILARLENNQKYYKKACESYSKYYATTIEQQAIIFETMASLNCNNKRNRWINSAIESWSLINKPWREKLIYGIQTNNTILEFETSETYPSLNLVEAKRIIIGNSKMTISENDIILSQADRVFRDWLSYQMLQSPFEGIPLVVFSEKSYYDTDELRPDLGWHEGGWLRDIQRHIDINHLVSVGVIAAYNEQDNQWYASDENGVFRFQIPKDKIYYPTTRFLTKDIALIIDTHGINMLVDHAMNSNVDFVMGCCDHPGKIKAAMYLSSNNISVICITDRFLHLALGHNSLIIGSPPMNFYQNLVSESIFDDNDNMNTVKSVTLGSRPIEITRGQKIAVLNIEEDKSYPYFYYGAPYYYFREINKTFRLDIYDYKIGSYYETEKIFNIARENEINLVGYRIFNSYDYNAAKEWLDESKQNKIILFHSASYPYGKLLFEEYPWQTSFNDPNPYIIE